MYLILFLKLFQKASWRNPENKKPAQLSLQPHKALQANHIEAEREEFDRAQVTQLIDQHQQAEWDQSSAGHDVPELAPAFNGSGWCSSGQKEWHQQAKLEC